MKNDISSRYVLKSAIEQLLGRSTWSDLKETTSLTPWRKQVLKLFKAIRISIHASVEVSDAAWLHAVESNISRGEKGAREAKDIDELLSCFTATLLRQVFLQIGMVPNKTTATRVSFRKEEWRLNNHRSVQYVQSKQQLEATFWSEQQTQIGDQKQRALYDEYRRSRSELPYSQWCREQTP